MRARAGRLLFGVVVVEIMHTAADLFFVVDVWRSRFRSGNVKLQQSE